MQGATRPSPPLRVTRASARAPNPAEEVRSISRRESGRTWRCWQRLFIIRLLLPSNIKAILYCQRHESVTKRDSVSQLARSTVGQRDAAPPCLAPDLDNLVDDLPEVLLEPLVARHPHALRLQAHLVKQGGMDIRDVMRVLHGVEANRVSGAVHHAALQSTARHPDAKPVGMVVAAVLVL